MIGFDTDQRLFYEGNANYGHAVWPTPMLTPAEFVIGDDLAKDLPSGTDLSNAKYVFREDSFDPVTRIRRGRFYASIGSQPGRWRVQIHPAIPSENREANKDGHIKKDLFTYQRMVAQAHLIQDSAKTVVLGSLDAQTRWMVVAIETIATAEQLVTLKALTTLGVLPRIKNERVPEVIREKLVEVVNMVRDAAFVAGPESLIDRCRDAAQVALAGASAQDGVLPTDDLSALIKRFESEKQRIVVASAAKIIARLHVRGKPNEQERSKMPLLREQDGQLAVSCLGTILRDLDWAEW